MIPSAERSLLTALGTAGSQASTISRSVTGIAAAAIVALAAGMPWALGVLIFQGPAYWQSAVARWAALVAVAVVILIAVACGARLLRFGQATSRTAAVIAARTHSGQYLTAAHFDARASTLLRRAQDAIDAVTSSQLCQAGLLDQAAYRTALAAHEWEIASALREQARLRLTRAQLATIARDSPARALLDRQHDVAKLADQSVASRVAALEQLAAEVRRADSAYRGWGDYAAVSELADQHLDMLARTAADPPAVAEINAMSEQARMAGTAFRDMDV